MEPFCDNITVQLTTATEVHFLRENSTTLDIYQAVAGCALFFIILPFVLTEFTFFPIGTTGAVLLGASLMVVCRIITQDEALEVLGARPNITTIFLLLGMMILAQFFEREKLLERLLQRIIPLNKPFWQLILRISVLSFIVSALFTNDVCCAALTPMLLRYWEGKRRSQVEVEVVLLAIATSSNIGSVTTIFGNPQMALIAARTAVPGFASVKLDLRACFTYLLLPAVLACAVNFAALIAFRSILLWKRRGGKQAARNRKSEGRGMLQFHAQNNAAVDNTSDSDHAKSQDESSMPNGCTTNPQFELHTRSKKSEAQPDDAISDHSVFEIADDVVRKDWTPSNSKLFCGILVVLLLAVIILFFASTDQVPFEMGTVPMCAAVIALVFDAALNHRPPTAILNAVDWNILLLFFGFFVWLDGLNKTEVPKWMWQHLGFQSALSNPNINSAGTLAIFCVFVVIGSNIFSNVPLTIIVLDQLAPCTSASGQFTLVLCLAWAATIAGNLTLFGSVANLIVSQKSAETVGYRLTFWRHLRFGFITTLPIIVIGVVIIVGLQAAAGTL